MSPAKYLTLTELIDKIEEPNRTSSYQLWKDHQEVFSTARGSKANHQSWPGGYLDHIVEVMNIAAVLYEPLNILRPLPFTLSDVLLVLYLHDLEKPWKYGKNEKGDWEFIPEFNERSKIKAFTEQKIKEYGFILTEDHHNGLEFVEGEFEQWSPSQRAQRPLAAFCHMCDNWSARGWYEYPSTENDPWQGARRNG